jgi:drug/metabolite transporter (DMT)-like permease
MAVVKILREATMKRSKNTYDRKNTSEHGSKLAKLILFLPSMFYIIATILISVLLLVIFKLFAQYNVNSLVAIIINYITATVTGILFFDGPFEPHKILTSQWVYLCVPLGGIFIAVFYLIGQTAQRISLSTASVANKMSVVIPVLFSVFFIGESLSLLKTGGVVLALLAVYLSTRTAPGKTVSEGTPASRLVWLPVLVFIGSGIIDTTINAANSFYIRSTEESALFSIATFLSAFIVGCFVLLYRIGTKRSGLSDIFNVKNIVAGVALGIPNYFSIYFIFKSLDAKIMTSAQLFPVLNLCNVAISAIVGWMIFKEKLSATNVAGIILALISIVIISM